MGIIGLSQRWKGPGSLQALELREDESTKEGQRGFRTLLYIYRFISFSYKPVIADASQNSQGRTSCISSQPSDSSQACQFALNKHKPIVGKRMLTRDMDANEGEHAVI